MTVTDNGRIWLLKVIRKEAMCDCNMMIITKLAYVVVLVFFLFCFVFFFHITFLWRSFGLYHVLFCRNSTYSSSLDPSFLALFTRILTKYIKKFLVFPLSFCLLPLLFLPSEEVKSAIGTTFSCS